MIQSRIWAHLLDVARVNLTHSTQTRNQVVVCLCSHLEMLWQVLLRKCQIELARQVEPPGARNQNVACHIRTMSELGK